MRGKVVRILSDMSGVPADQISNSSLLGEDLELTSIQLLDMLAVLENEFHVKIDDRKLPDIQTVEDVIQMIEGLIG